MSKVGSALKQGPPHLRINVCVCGEGVAAKSLFSPVPSAVKRKIIIIIFHFYK